jgi:hypothetical protein
MPCRSYGGVGVRCRRQPPAVPAVPAGTAVPGIEDEDEDEKAPRTSPGTAGPFSLHRISVSGDSTKRRDEVWGRSVADKA